MNRMIILGHHNPDVDSLVSGYLVKSLLSRNNIDAKFIIPDNYIDDESLNICLRYNFDPRNYQGILPEHSKYILVDHNSRDVNGDIIAIIDHHPDFEKKEIPYYINKRISSTSCLICQGNEEFFTDQEIELACVATMVDTASFHSTKGRDKDKIWVQNMCKQRGFDYQKIYQTGLCLTKLENVEKTSLNGLKKYNIDNYKIESSYIQIENRDQNKEYINSIIEYLKQYIINQKIDIFVFIVHDMTNFKSSAYIVDQGKVLKRVYNNYTSRGTTVIPDVVNNILHQKTYK